MTTPPYAEMSPPAHSTEKLATLCIVAGWFALVALGLALAVRTATEPPVWDALSYVQKAYGFWHMFADGKFINPFDLPMAVRPPGTILMAYPFGWSDDFRWFYFRSCIFPIGLLIAAVYIAASSQQVTRTGWWIVAAFAVALAGMPIFYQFQANDVLPGAVYWGLVDGFQAGLSAIAAAAILRSVATRSVAWSVAAAAAGGFCLWIKPSGLALIAIVGMTWVLLAGSSIGWNVTTLRHDRNVRRFIVRSFAVATVIFITAVGLVFTSSYFSADNIAFGKRALVILKREFFSAISFSFLAQLVRTSLGFVVPALLAIGLFVSLLRRDSLAHALSAVICLLIGIWLWFFETDAGQIRYFLPCITMAFIVLLPPLLRWLQTIKSSVAYGLMTVAVAPTLITTVLLLSPSPGITWQRALGINLHANDYRAENLQARDLISALQAEGATRAKIYLSNTTSVLRNLQSVWDYARVAGPRVPEITAVVPIDWQRPSTLRSEDLLRSNFIAAENIRDAQARETVLAQRKVTDFPALASLVDAWVSGLGENDGVAVVSETRVKLLRVIDPVKLDAALARLEADYDLPEAYRAANPQRWWSRDDLASRRGNMLAAPVGFRATPDGPVLRSVLAAEMHASDMGPQLSLWLESAPEDTLDHEWRIFAHALNAAGEIVGNAESSLLPGRGPSPDKNVRAYTVSFPPLPPTATTVAFGIFKPHDGTIDFTVADGGARDWNDKRLILPLSGQ
jgi:hypothetical protein